MNLINMEQGIHYRTGGKLTHVGCECLPGGKDIEYIVIESIEYKPQERINGRTEENVWVAHFAKNPYTNLPMILNSTNRKRIAKLFPEVDGYINLLKNIPVRLTREKCRDIQDGGETYGLRISKIPAKKPAARRKTVLSKDDADKWQKAIEYLRAGNAIEKIDAAYDITPEAREELLKEAQDGQRPAEG